MKKWFPVVFLLMLTAQLNAQVPGFLGRRFSVQADVFMNLAFSNMVHVDQPNPGIVKGLNTRWNGSVNYVTGRKTSIGLDFHYVGTAFSSDSYDLPPGISNLHPLDAYFFGIHFKKFFGRNLAPVGPYLKVEAGGAYLRSSVLQQGNPQSGQDRMETINGGTFYTQLSLGRQHIFFKRMILDYGVQFGLTGVEALFFFEGEEINRLARIRLLNHTLINFYAGVGIVF